MCCFSGKVDSVGSTKIFARSLASGRQLIVYEMMFAAKADLAMILPLPVPAGSGGDALKFISLKEYPELFRDLRAGFPEPRALSKGEPMPLSKPAAEAPLPVVAVGDCEASFVPKQADFSRLDARFRLPDLLSAESALDIAPQSHGLSRKAAAGSRMSASTFLCSLPSSGSNT
jgi:hypothetical protein